MDEHLVQGDRLGRYRLLTELGRGGMASVWVALDRSAPAGPRFVALKVMLPRLARQSAFRAMFLDEGQLVRSIDHAGVVRVYEVGEDRGVLFMAMEWVEGDSLHTLIKEARKRRAVPPELAVRMIADVAGGLHEAHELRGWDGELRGVVHCDVSPHNILIGLEGSAKLTDFGVAHAAALSEPEREGGAMGKVGYMSPEQAFGGKLDRRSDIFSLGVVLFELTTGKRLFARADLKETLELVRRAAVPPPSTVWPDYPRLLEPIVMRALAREPSRRYKTAEEFRRVLEQYLIETRTMVSPAGVGRLLARVIGPTIAARREEVRAALAKLHEPTPKNAMLIAVPSPEGGEEGERTETTDGWTGVHTGTGSLDGSTGPTATASGPPRSSTGSSASGVSSRTVSPHGVDAARPARQRWPFLIAGAAVLAAAVAVVVALGNRGEPVPAAAPAAASAPRPHDPSRPAAPGEEAAGDDGEAVSLDAIPIDEIPAARPAVAGPVGPRSGVDAPVAATAPSTAPGEAPPAETAPAETAPAQPTAQPGDDMGFLEEKPAEPPPTGADLGIDNPYR